MAGLDGRIEIGIDYRPCIVRIPEERKYFYENHKRKYRVKNSAQDVKALFHCWSYRSELVGESLLRGGHPGGQVSATFGLVEYEDGTIHEVESQNIRFVDGRINEYGFWEEEDAGKCED